MDCFQHESYRFHLVTRCNGKDISVEMYGTSLISGIRKNFRNGFQHPQILITDNQTYTSKPAFLQSYKERTPALTILFHAFRSAKNFTTSILADADCNENGNVLDLATPAAFQRNTIHINIWIVPGKRACPSGFDMFISLFIEVANRPRRHFCSP